MQSGRLRREKLVLFLSKRITTNPPAQRGQATPCRSLPARSASVQRSVRPASARHCLALRAARLPGHGDVHRGFVPVLRHLPQSLLPQAGELRPDPPVQAGGNHPPKLLASGRAGRAELRVLCGRILSQSRHSQTPSAAHAARSLLGADLAAVPRLLDHRQSLPTQCPQGNRPHRKVARTRARRLSRRGQAFATHGQGGQGAANPATGAGGCGSLQIRFCRSRLGRKRGRADFQDAADRSRLQPDGGRPMLDLQRFLGGHDEEHLVPDLAGLDMGNIRSPCRSRPGRMAGRSASALLHLHGTSRRGRSALRRIESQSDRCPQFSFRHAAARGPARA